MSCCQKTNLKSNLPCFMKLAMSYWATKIRLIISKLNLRLTNKNAKQTSLPENIWVYNIYVPIIPLKKFFKRINQILLMAKLFHLTPIRWKTLASVFLNVGQAVLLFSFAALFAPKAVNLTDDYSKVLVVFAFISGLLSILFGVIISEKGK